MSPARWPDSTEDQLMALVTWECLDNQSVDPKLILRTLSLADLSILHTNVSSARESSIDHFVVVKMIKVELMYRLGQLQGDWTFLRLGERINLRFTALKGDLVSQFHETSSA